MQGEPTFEDDALPDDLYHYTTAAGLHGILESNSLYASHASYLNDSQELLYGVQIALDELKEWVKSTPEEAKAGWDTSLPDWMVSVSVKLSAVLLGAQVQRRAKNLQQTFGPFVTCLSESRDQLSQWRGYGRGGGYAIRFDGQALRESVKRDREYLGQALREESVKHRVPLFTARFLKMAYEKDTQTPIVRRELIAFMNAVADRITPEKQSPEALEKLRNDLVEPFTTWLVLMAMHLKNPGFQEEREYRIATFSTPELFTPAEAGLIPRVKLKFDPACVREVIIGPGLHMDTRESSVRYYLITKTDESHKTKYPGVEINPSKTPYRGD